jgi:hypothetical protein
VYCMAKCIAVIVFVSFFARLLVYFCVCINTFRTSLLCSPFDPFYSTRFSARCLLFSHIDVYFSKYA